MHIQRKGFVNSWFKLPKIPLSLMQLNDIYYCSKVSQIRCETLEIVKYIVHSIDGKIVHSIDGKQYILNRSVCDYEMLQSR